MLDERRIAKAFERARELAEPPESYWRQYEAGLSVRLDRCRRSLGISKVGRVAVAAAALLVLIAGVWFAERTSTHSPTAGGGTDRRAAAHLAVPAVQGEVQSLAPRELRPAASTRATRGPRTRASRPPAGNEFVPLPYSNPYLPMQAADIVHIRMQLSTLESVGLVPITQAPGDDWVRADVLLGMDGEPFAIRLASTAGQ